MNKNDFTNELKELMSSMSEEEIEKTINALSGCKSAVYKKKIKKKARKPDSSLLLNVTRQNYIMLEKGKKKVLLKQLELLF